MTDSTLEAIRRHRNTAVVIARGFCRKLPKTVPREDIEQAALIGLWEWKRNHPDEASPGWIAGMRTRVRGAIVDELRHQDWLPRYTRRDHGHLRVIGIEDVDTDWSETWAGPGASCEVALQTKQEFEEAMRAPLLPRDAQVIDQHYFRGVNFREIGEQLGVSEPRISQMHSRAIEKMRAQLEGNEAELAVARRQLKRAELSAAKETNAKADRPSGIYLVVPPVTSTLPEEGVDLRKEVTRYQEWMIEQALIRSGGNKAQAAKLLGLNRTTLVEMLKSGAPMRTAPKATKQPATPVAKPAIVDGCERISRAAIARLRSEGKTARQIASALGVNRYLVERELRRPMPLAKCGQREEA